MSHTSVTACTMLISRACQVICVLILIPLSSGILWTSFLSYSCSFFCLTKSLMLPAHSRWPEFFSSWNKLISEIVGRASASDNQSTSAHLVICSVFYLSGPRGGIWANTWLTPGWAASSQRDPKWAFVYSLPCSKVPRQCSEGDLAPIYLHY